MSVRPTPELEWSRNKSVLSHEKVTYPDEPVVFRTPMVRGSRIPPFRAGSHAGAAGYRGPFTSCRARPGLEWLLFPTPLTGGPEPTGRPKD
jgi:hypothetical protein